MGTPPTPPEHLWLPLEEDPEAVAEAEGRAAGARTADPDDLPPIPFGRVLKFRIPWMSGTDVEGVSRALVHAGHGTLKKTVKYYGPGMRDKVKAFQKEHKLTADGVYGEKTHKKLVPYFDAYGFLLYTGHNPNKPVDVGLQLPYAFRATHSTAGLPGYPAVDNFAKPDSTVGAPADGIIRRLSGKDPARGGVPGGAYGWSIYLRRLDGGDYFLTHFRTRTVKLGQKVARGDIIGTVCDPRVAHMPSSLAHIHEGFSAPV